MPTYLTSHQAAGFLQVTRTTVTGYLSLRAGKLASSTLERNRHYLIRWLQALGEDA